MFRGRSGLAGLAARSNNPEDRREVDSDNNRQAWYSQTPPSQLISMEHIVRHSVIHIHSQAGVVVVAIRHGPDGTGLPPAPGPLPPSPPGPHTHRILGATVVETAGLFLRPPVFPGCVSVRRGAVGEG